MPLFPNPPINVPPLASDIVVNGGVYVPKRALDRWAVGLPGLATVVCVGDSVVQGTAIRSGITNGYLDAFVQRLQRALGNVYAGGVRGAGFFGVWRSANTKGYANSASEWSFAGTWNLVGSGGANAMTPYQATIAGSGGAASVATFTPPPSVAPRTVGDASTFANTLTVAASMNGVHANTFAGAGVLAVNESTAGLPASGVIVVAPAGGTLNPTAVMLYTALGANSFTGCTWLATSDDVTFAAGQPASNANVVQSPTAAFVAANDQGQTIYGANLPRNNNVVWVADATHIVVQAAATAAGTGALGLLGRNIVPGGIQQVDIYYVDFLGAGTWSYSLDNGATWNNVVPAAVASRVKKVSVTTTLPNGTIQIRPADNAGVGHPMNLAGVSLLNAVAPTSGVIIHNLCRDGATYNPTTAGAVPQGLLTPAGSGDYLRLIDNAGDSGNQSFQPVLVIACFSNDADLVQAGTITLAQYQANIAALIARVSGYADVVIVNPMEQTFRTASNATQAACRAAAKAQAAASGVACLDLYDAWAAQGDTGWGPSYADGLMENFVHPSLEGHADLTGHLMRLLAVMAV